MLLLGSPSFGLWLNACFTLTAMHFNFVSLQQRPPDGGEVAEVTLGLLLQVERLNVLC